VEQVALESKLLSVPARLRCQMQEREHEGLEIWNGHFVTPNVD